MQYPGVDEFLHAMKRHQRLKVIQIKHRAVAFARVVLGVDHLHNFRRKGKGTTDIQLELATGCDEISERGRRDLGNTVAASERARTLTN